MKTNQNLHKMAKAKRNACGALLIRYCVFFALLLMGVSASFAQVTKTSTGSGSWGAASTWSPSGVPASGDNVVIAAGHTVTLGANASTTGTLTVNGTLNRGTRNMTAGSLSGASTGVITSTGGSLTVGSNDISTTYAGKISGSAGTGGRILNKRGTGTLTLTGNSDYIAGDVWVSTGTLRLGVAGALPTTARISVYNGGTFDLNGYSQTVRVLQDGSTIINPPSPVAIVTNSSATAATLTLGTVGAEEYSSFAGTMTGKLNMVVNDGMYLQGSGFGADVNVSVSNGATLELGLVGPPSVSTVLGGNLSVATGGKVSLAQNATCNTLTLGATLQSAGTYGSTASSATTKNNTVFNVANTGVLTVNTGAAPTPANKVSNQTGNWDNPAIWTPYGVPVLNDNVRVFPGHTVTLNSAVNTGTGRLQVDGTLALAGFDMTAGALVGNGTISSASGTPTLTVGSNNTNDIWNGAYSGTGARFTKVGTGSFFFAGGLSPNTYTGATTINAGRVQIATANERLSNSTDVFVASGAIFDLGGRTETVRSLAGAGTVTSVFNGGVLIVSGPANTTFSGILQNGTSGTLALTKAGTGTLTLTGANTYTGATNVSAGTLQLGGANERISNSSALTVAAGAFFDLNGVSETIGSLAGAGRVTSSVAGPATITHGSNSSSTFSGVIQNGSGTVALTKSGTGTLTLTGANTYTGATSITAGTLIAGNSTALGSGSSVSVSSGATLRTNAGLSLGSLSIAGVMNCNGNNSTCTNLILGTTVQTNSGTYGSTASGATYQNNTRFTSTSTGVVTLTIPLTPSTFPGGTSIQARARWGATGYEGGLFIGGTVGPQLNPAGAPVWVIGTAYTFAYGYNSATGDQTLSIDFDGDLSFGAGEVITQSTGFAGQGFKHFSIFMSGDATRGIALNNFVVNGVNLGNHVSPATGSLDLDWENPAGLFSDITATGTITFTGATDGSGEVGRIWFRTAVPQPLVTPTQGRIQGIPKDMMEALGTNAVLSLHPNPTVTGQVTFRIPMDGLRPNNGKLSSTVEVFDYTGSMKMSRGVTLDNTGRGELDASSLIRGAYIIRVKVAGKAFTTRMIRQ